MRKFSSILVLLLVLALCLFPVKNVEAGLNTPINFVETDTNFTGGSLFSLFYVFDLRDRESFIQLTFPDSSNIGLPANIHIQIFDVGNNCNENDFFDVYTVNDTHTYNLRDIQTNDGNPSGVVLPDDAYGIIAVSGGNRVFGNIRIVDNNGYEYRTNAVGPSGGSLDAEPETFFSFNFNQESGVTLSDVIGATARFGTNGATIEWVTNPLEAFNSFDIDIIDNNEVPFSCRDVIFSCVDQEHPLLEELLAFAGTASVASYEYGINNVIPHSKGGELLCPGNVTPEGIVILRPEAQPSLEDFPSFFGFIGLNNGNGRGSFDSFRNSFNPDLLLR